MSTPAFVILLSWCVVASFLSPDCVSRTCELETRDEMDVTNALRLPSRCGPKAVSSVPVAPLSVTEGAGRQPYFLGLTWSALMDGLNLPIPQLSPTP